MSAELVVVQGPWRGTQFTLSGADFVIGRAPANSLVLTAPGIGWRHCAVQAHEGRYRIVDFRSGAGTFVNGVRLSQPHWLAAGDRILVGETALLFRDGSQPPAQEGVQTTLLRACSLLFLVQALASMEEATRRALLEAQLFQIISDLAPVQSGVLLLARSEKELAGEAGKRALPGVDLQRLAAEACELGPAQVPGWCAVPIYVRGSIQGLLAARTGDPARCLDVLSSIAVLAATALETAREVQTLKADNELLLDAAAENRPGVIGRSAAIRKLEEMIQRVGPRDTTVLILGESGTGKELVAHAVHQRSSRRERPFVAINCAALTETLLESEMFGHEKGAFTGAIAQKKGKLESAEGGTVFLDEIGEMSASLQAKLLRVLQQREFERVGGTNTHRLDVRFIAATNRDLAEEVRRRNFREDLYHRLNVVALRTTPLRERKEDIPMLAKHFLEKAAAQVNRRVGGISKEAESCLIEYDWPGNVRELENAIERAVVLGETDQLLPEDLPESVLEASTAKSAGAGFQSAVGDAKRRCILDAWEQAGGDYKAAAELLGLHPNSLLRLIRNLGLRDMFKRV